MDTLVGDYDISGALLSGRMTPEVVPERDGNVTVPEPLRNLEGPSLVTWQKKQQRIRSYLQKRDATRCSVAEFYIPRRTGY